MVTSMLPQRLAEKKWTQKDLSRKTGIPLLSDLVNTASKTQRLELSTSYMKNYKADTPQRSVGLWLTREEIGPSIRTINPQMATIIYQTKSLKAVQSGLYCPVDYIFATSLLLMTDTSQNFQ